MTDSRFLDLVDGANNGLWITGVKFEAGTERSPRQKVALIVATMPTKQSFTSPYTNVAVQIPSKEDPVNTKIILDDKIKRILFPLVGFEPGNNEDGSKKKLSFKNLCVQLKDQLTAYDLKVDIIAKSQTSDKFLDQEGNPKKFTEVVTLSLVGYEEKGEYDSDMDYDG